MPLLHQILVQRMRQNAQSGGSPAVVVGVRAATLLVGMVAGEMGSPPMKASVGAPPWDVEYGLPGARAQTRAYITRVNNVLVVPIQDAFVDWARERFPEEEKSPAPTFDERQFLIDWPAWYAKWNGWMVETGTVLPPGGVPDGPNPFGMSANEAWQKTEIYEAEARAFRTRLATITAGMNAAKEVPPEPKTPTLEKPGGEPPGSPLSGAGDLLGKIPWTPILVVAGVFGAGAVLSGVGRLRGSGSPAPSR